MNDARASSARPRRRPSTLVASELLEAALVEFASRGFEGASTRAIAERAGWHQPQINYHFSSKEQLWRAAVDHLFGLLTAALGAAPPDPDPTGAFAESVRRFVRFSAHHPELHRIMNQESTADSARLAWIVDTHLRHRYDWLRRAWARVPEADRGPYTALEVWELLVGFGALPYANAPILERLAGAHLTSDEAIEARAERVVSVLLTARARARRVVSGRRAPAARTRSSPRTRGGR
jgi:AcrR family transcriptional regulator